MIKEIQIMITREKTFWRAEGVRDGKVKAKGKGFTRLQSVEAMLHEMDSIGRNNNINHDLLQS